MAFMKVLSKVHLSPKVKVQRIEIKESVCSPTFNFYSQPHDIVSNEIPACTRVHAGSISKVLKVTANVHNG